MNSTTDENTPVELNDQGMLEIFRSGNMNMQLKTGLLTALGDKSIYYSVENPHCTDCDTTAKLGTYNYIPQKEEPQYIEADIWQYGLDEETRKGFREDIFCAKLPLVLQHTETKAISALSDEELARAGFDLQTGRMELAHQNGNPAPIDTAIAAFAENFATRQQMPENAALMLSALIKGQLGLDGGAKTQDESMNALSAQLAGQFKQMIPTILPTEKLEGNVRLYSVRVPSAKELVTMEVCKTEQEADTMIGKAYANIHAELSNPFSAAGENALRDSLRNSVPKFDQRLAELKAKSETLISTDRSTPAADSVSSTEHAGNLGIAESIVAAR